MPLFTIDHFAPPAVAKACPSLQGTAPSIQIKDVSFVPPSILLPQTLLRITLANVYNGNPQTGDPAKRYFLGRFQFDHGFSVIGPTTPGVDCSGFEVPLRFDTYCTSYVDTQGMEWSFGLGGTGTVTSKGVETCLPVPAETSTSSCSSPPTAPGGDTLPGAVSSSRVRGKMTAATNPGWSQLLAPGTGTATMRRTWSHSPLPSKVTATTWAHPPSGPIPCRIPIW